MAFGMKLPQGDKTVRRAKKTKPGPDDSTKTKMADNLTAPNIPQRDGPARDSVAGKIAGKPPTSAPAKGKRKSGIPAKTLASMKTSLAGLGRF